MLDVARHPDAGQTAPERAATVCVVSAGLPFPATGASRVVFNAYMKALCASDCRVSQIVLSHADPVDGATIEAYREDIGAGPDFSITFVDAMPVVSAGRMTLNVHSGVAEATRHLRSARADAIVCFDIECALAAAPIREARKFVWIGDLHYQTVWYHFIYSLSEDWKNLISLPWIVRRIALWKRMYRETLREFEDVVVCANRSVEDLRKIGVRSRFAPYPWPSLAAESRLERDAPAKPSFIFFGRLGGLGSRSSFHFLLDRLYPELVSNWGPSGFVLDICGLDQLPDWVQKSLANKPEMAFLGFVPDLDAQMRRYHAMVVPIDVPVGNRTRILTAMANGLPVVAHTSVALGNPSLVDGDTCRLANDTGGFARALKWCVEEPDAALAMAQRARSSWKAEYSPEKASVLFVDALARTRQ